MLKKTRGFTLIELVLGTAILMLIIGAIAMLFGTSMQAFVNGNDQATAYAEARAVMNDIKNTLRYADRGSIEFDADVGVLEYNSVGYEKAKESATSKSSVQVMDSSDKTNGTARTFYRKIEWNPGSENTQIKITKIDNNKNSEVIFPNNAKYSAFSDSTYYKAWLDATGLEMSGSTFPIYEAPAGILNIILPVKYNFKGGSFKVDVLRSKVSVEEIQDDPEIPRRQAIKNGIMNVYKTNPAVLKNKDGKTYVSNITSGGEYVDLNRYAGATNKLVSYMKEHMGDSVAMMKERSWALVAYNKNGGKLSGSQELGKYRMYIAKNVVDDIPVNDNGQEDRTGGKPLNDRGAAGLQKMIDAANNDGTLYIRGTYACLVSVFDIYMEDMPAENAKAGDEKQVFEDRYAYIVCKTDNNAGYNGTSTRVLDPNNLQHINYRSLRDSGANSGSWIEDQVDSSGNVTDKGKYTRLDYDGNGMEWTKSVVGDSYTYPPNMATGKSEK